MSVDVERLTRAAAAAPAREPAPAAALGWSRPHFSTVFWMTVRPSAGLAFHFCADEPSQVATSM